MIVIHKRHPQKETIMKYLALLTLLVMTGCAGGGAEFVNDLSGIAQAVVDTTGLIVQVGNEVSDIVNSVVH